MPLPQGTVPIGGPIIDTSGALLTASATLRDNGVISFRGGRLRRVNTAADGWEDVPGHVVSATEPTDPFEGQLWWDTANDELKGYDGSSFTALGGGASITVGTADPTGGAGGDIHIQVNATDVVQSIWRNNSGTWGEYTIPAGTSAGDITAVTTASESGLAGGAESGAADLTLSLSNLEGQTGIGGSDHLGFDDVSATQTKRITVQNFAAHLGPTSGGLAPTTSGQLHVRIHGLPGLTTFEGSDEVVLTDDSTSDNVSKKATLEHFAGYLAGTGLTAFDGGGAVG